MTEQRNFDSKLWWRRSFGEESGEGENKRSMMRQGSPTNGVEFS